MISLKAIHKSFGTKPVLTGLSLELRESHSLALLGLSGSGKTTILRLICGLIFPDQGEVRVGSDAVEKANLRRIRERIGYVSQDGGLFPHLSARENLELAGEAAGWNRERIRARIEELSSLTRIEPELLKQLPRELSGGQRQRVSLMRALLRDPQILLFDEAFSALDPITRADLQKEVRELALRLGKTTLLVTHDVREASVLAEEILLLHEGRAIQRGTLSNLRSAPANEFVTRFLKAQEME